MYHKTYEANLSEYVSIYHQYDHTKYMHKELSDSTIPNTPQVKSEKSAGPVETESSIKKDAWVSPSDTLLEHTKLVPPFTSKIHRAFAHEGLLAIGDQVLQLKRNLFLQKLNRIIEENDAAWAYILENQREIMEIKVNKVFGKLREKKCQILLEESSSFFLTTLQEMEQSLLKTIKAMVDNAHASMVSDLNVKIKEKLKKEKKSLDKKLYKKLVKELKKIEEYYRLLLRNEICRKTQFINQSLLSRNQAYDIYLKHLEAENITGCMYVMSNERRKCYIRKLNIEKLYTQEAFEKIQEVKNRKQILTDYQMKPSLASVNKDWENKIQKIIQLFVKFISFGLKLLPEQTSFLLKFQNILLIQMNEIMQNPLYPKPTLVNVSNQNREDFDIKFLKSHHCSSKAPCPKPFIVEGALNPPTPKQRDSEESLSLSEELPYFRVDRKYFYARCEKLEEVTKMLQEKAIVCISNQSVAPNPVASKEISIISEENEAAQPTSKHTPSNTEVEAESSLEDLPLPEYKRFEECPLNCYKKYVHELDFPPLNEYFDFTEEKYRLVKGMLSDIKIKPKATLVDVQELINKYTVEVAFDATKHVTYDEGTQYCSKESLIEDSVNLENACTCEKVPFKIESKMDKQATPTDVEIKTLRKQSLLKILHERPSLINILSDEWYNVLQK